MQTQGTDSDTRRDESESQRETSKIGKKGTFLTTFTYFTVQKELQHRKKKTKKSKLNSNVENSVMYNVWLDISNQRSTGSQRWDVGIGVTCDLQLVSSLAAAFCVRELLGGDKRRWNWGRKILMYGRICCWQHWLDFDEISEVCLHLWVRLSKWRFCLRLHWDFSRSLRHDKAETRFHLCWD